ncbi:MAG: ABC transporter permease, partial [Bacteroidetes bacterium]|nr:ABC transporter permease [Bacteroidota bacterium]
MIKHFFRVVLRMIIRNKMVTTLNVTGLAAGLLCFILIYLLITDELQYDHFHAKAPRLYRI